jgi:hypothetical protein
MVLFVRGWKLADFDLKLLPYLLGFRTGIVSRGRGGLLGVLQVFRIAGHCQRVFYKRMIFNGSEASRTSINCSFGRCKCQYVFELSMLTRARVDAYSGARTRKSAVH